MKHSGLALLFCLFLGGACLHAQEQGSLGEGVAGQARNDGKDNANDKGKGDAELPNYAVSVEPFYLFNGGLRLNVEKRLSAREWVELNVTGYILSYREITESGLYLSDPEEGGHVTSNSDFYRFTELSGFGLGGTYKYYAWKTIYFSANVAYTYYNVGYLDWNFLPYEEDGLVFYEYGSQNTHQQFNKVLGNLCIGVRSFFTHKYMIEFYGGLGYAHSFYNPDKRAYNETSFGFGYKGVYPVFGMKLGLNIP
ncbi:hypothetical protein AGMMS49982_23870 [Bacteroidia bacterium]|nr:hypothetical protein AGMMS49982_23870 [Bacteroidia bacterium]